MVIWQHIWRNLAHRPQDAVKTMFYLYSLFDDHAQSIISFEDRVDSVAWSPVDWN